jgi:hypothetical protein
MGPLLWGKPQSELTGPPAFKKGLKPPSPAYDLSGHCEALEIIGFPKAVAEKETKREAPKHGASHDIGGGVKHQTPCVLNGRRMLLCQQGGNRFPPQVFSF